MHTCPPSAYLCPPSAHRHVVEVVVEVGAVVDFDVVGVVVEIDVEAVVVEVGSSLWSDRPVRAG
jgi:hypothetical protein